MQVSKGIIFYTDSRIGEPIKSIVQKHVHDSGLPIVSVSLKPMYFGQNFVVRGERGYPTMVNQIVVALESSTEKYVFFCEHDVLYHRTHFDFTPPTDSLYYYNTNDWRWDYPKDRLFKYDGLSSLSQMCCNRELALAHYKERQRRIAEHPERFLTREPAQARAWGYEPGTKHRHNGGFNNETSDRWHSFFPNIDIRHPGTFSPPKTEYSSYKYPPTGWEETTMDKIEGWNLRKEFNL
jgi:hypothetical protein